jgi:DNA-binding response OmpR family regulator
MRTVAGIAFELEHIHYAHEALIALVARGVPTSLVPLDSNFTEALVDFLSFDALLLVGSTPVLLTLLAQLRERPNKSLVLALDPDLDSAKRAQLTHAGVDDCFDKKGAQLVVHRVRTLFDRPRSGTYPAVSASTIGEGNAASRAIAVDFVRQAIVIDGVSTELTRSELSLLKYLVDQPNRWHAHAEVREAVFGATALGDSSLVRVHLHNIRKKLGSAARLIVTERYRGTMVALDEPSVPNVG